MVLDGTVSKANFAKIENYLPNNLKSKIELVDEKLHPKASGKFLIVNFGYGKKKRNEIPVVTVDDRLGIKITAPKKIAKQIQKCYNYEDPANINDWKKVTAEFRRNSGQRNKTERVFDALDKETWACNKHSFPQDLSPPERILQLRKNGLTIAAKTSRYCRQCKKNTHQSFLCRIPPQSSRSDDTISEKLRKKIFKTFKNIDAYENKKELDKLLPEHKFPEIRWGKEDHSSSDDMTVKEIKAKFQLYTNKRNLEKREVCRKCFQTGKRGIMMGINFFYKGDGNWPKEVPKKGIDAEKGCEGCGWYDTQKWREELNKELQKQKKKKSTKKP